MRTNTVVPVGIATFFGMNEAQVAPVGPGVSHESTTALTTERTWRSVGNSMIFPPTRHCSRECVWLESGKSVVYICMYIQLATLNQRRQIYHGPIMSGSFAERDPQLQASYASSPPCTHISPILWWGYVYIYMCICIYMYVYMYTYIYIHVHIYI